MTIKNDNLILNHIPIIFNYCIGNIITCDNIYYILNNNFAKLYICNKSLYNEIHKYLLRCFIKFKILYFDTNLNLISNFKYLISNDIKFKLSIRKLNSIKKKNIKKDNIKNSYRVYYVYECKCIKCRNIVSYLNPFFFNFGENPKCLNRYNQYNKVIKSNLLKKVDNNKFRLKKPIFIYTSKITV
jgi:hypothetical protein